MAEAAASMLAEAQTALHQLMTGSRIVEIRNPNGSVVTFQQADIDKLRSYISELQQAAGTVRRPVFFEYRR